MARPVNRVAPRRHRPTSLTSPSRSSVRGGPGVEPPAALDRQRLPGDLVDHVEQVQQAAVGRLMIELEIQRRDVIGPLGPQPLRRHGRRAQPLALAPLYACVGRASVTRSRPGTSIVLRFGVVAFGAVLRFLGGLPCSAMGAPLPSHVCLVTSSLSEFGEGSPWIVEL